MGRFHRISWPSGRKTEMEETIPRDERSYSGRLFGVLTFGDPVLSAIRYGQRDEGKEMKPRELDHLNTSRAAC